MTVIAPTSPSDDVAHSWWIPAARRQDGRGPRATSTRPGSRPPRPATYRGQCAELCGRNHANMTARVRVVPFDEYQAWFDREAADIKVARDEGAKQRAEINKQAVDDPDPVGSLPRPMAITSDTETTTARRSLARPQILGREARPEAKGLDVVDHHDRPQEDRDHVPVHGPRVLPAGRRRGAAAEDPARGAGQHVPEPREVQPDLHHARDDDDLPRRRAAVGGLRELPGAADDRRARRRLPAHQRLVVLDVPVRRDRALRVGLLPAARGRLVLLRAALVQGVLALRRPGRVDLHGPPHRPVVDARRRQLHRHDPQHARARHGLGPHPAVRVDDPDLRVPDRARAVLARRDGDDAAARPQLRHALLRPDAGRVGAAVAAPLLVLRPPRGLHPRAARVRRLLRGAAGVRPQADLRLQGDRGLDRRHRVPRHARVGAPHVRHADVDRRAGVLHALELPDRGADRREDLQLGGDAVARHDRVPRAAALLRGRHRHVPDGRDHRHLPRRLPGRLAADRHLLRRRALPLHGVRRRRLRGSSARSTTGSRR